MKRILQFSAFFFVSTFLFCAITNAQSDDRSNSAIEDTSLSVVVPNAYNATPGTASFTGPFATTARTYQLLIHQDQLAELVGKSLTSIDFRLPTSATAAWPAAPVEVTSYDIYLSESVPPANRSLTFAQNVVGVQTQVRTGTLSIHENSYPFGGSPNAWGSGIDFINPYLYPGGHLLIEIRHTGYTGTSRAVDAIGTTVPGYATQFSAAWASGNTATSGSQGNFAVVKINGTDVIPVELSSFTASTSGSTITLNWATATELNNKGFEIERKMNDGSFAQIGFVNGNGTTVEPKNYSFIDNPGAGVHIYRLKQVDFDGSFEYSNEVEVEIEVPAEFSLGQNYPNPFNPSTTINFGLAVDSKVTMILFNSLGEVVATLINNEFKEAGYHNYQLSTINYQLPSGVYFYQIEARGVDGKNFSSAKKLILMK